ncbi:MAG: hypothetical protein IPO63_02955 [Bacteroidetes bacterium]|nr:hypothetical protein [Bacteroidota bacterium]
MSFDKNLRNSISNNLLHHRLNVKWKPTSKLTTTGEFRTRLFWGEEVNSIPEFAMQLRNDNEKVNLQKAWIQNKSLVLHSNIERLNIEYRENNWNVCLGRQRINWGVTTTWNPNDIFNAFNFLDFDYEERPGVDGGKFQYMFNNSFNTQVVYVHTGNRKGNVAAVKYSLNKWQYDLQLITGWYKEHITLGAGWAGNIKDAGFKGEVQYFFRDNDSTSQFNLTLEGDYMFKNGWYISTGFLFNNNGLYQPISNWNNINLNLSPENIMPTRWNFMVTTAKEITPLLSANLSLLYSPGTNLIILLPSFKYNLASNLDVDIIWQSFFVELKKDFEAVNHRIFLRIKWSF